MQSNPEQSTVLWGSRPYTAMLNPVPLSPYSMRSRMPPRQNIVENHSAWVLAGPGRGLPTRVQRADAAGAARDGGHVVGLRLRAQRHVSALSATCACVPWCACQLRCHLISVGGGDVQCWHGGGHCRDCNGISCMRVVVLDLGKILAVAAVSLVGLTPDASVHRTWAGVRSRRCRSTLP